MARVLRRAARSRALRNQSWYLLGLLTTSLAINGLMLAHLMKGGAPDGLQPFVVLNLMVALLALAS